MSDPLTWLWPHVDAPEPLFSEHALSAWSDRAFGELVTSGFLCQAHDAPWVTCPTCGDHVEEPLLLDGPDGTSELFIYCPSTLRVRVPWESLRQWTIDFDVLARAVARAFTLSGQGTALGPGRLWRLGRTQWQGTSRDVLLARGLTWHDSGNLAAQVAHAIRPIVLVADRIPTVDLWRGRVPPVIALSQVTQLHEGRLVLDGDAVAAAILDVETDRGAESSSSIDMRQLKLMIRQQVKAEEKSQLTDDVLVAAYRQEGSVRKAAAFLTQQTGQMVTKDKVQAAVSRAGGAAAVFRSDDSDSIVRTVASQHRDRTRKTLRKPERVEDQEFT